jgi:hypothetical protein
LAAFQDGCEAFHEDWLVTCGAEGHPPSDPHSSGEAFDIGVLMWNPPQVVERYHWLVNRLGSLFYCQYERPDNSIVPALAAIEVVNPNATGPHFHCQRARGTVYPPV